MFVNFLMKKPILMIGLLMFSIFLMNAWDKLGFLKRDLQTTACHGNLSKLEKNLPETWKVYCEGNNLAAEIKVLGIEANDKQLKEKMYRSLANHLMTISTLSQPDLLEKIMMVRLRLDHPKLQVNAISEGRYVAKLIGLKSQSHIAEHLQQTVQVNDVAK